MDSQLYSVELQISRGAIKADAIIYAIFGSLFLLFSLIPLILDLFLWSAVVYSPFLLAAFLGFICSKTHHKSYLECYSLTLVVTAVYFGVLTVVAIVLFVISIFAALKAECEGDSCEIGEFIYTLAAILLLILTLLLVSNFVLTIYAIGHSDKVKGLLSKNMKKYQESLMAQQAAAYPQQANEDYYR